MSRRLVFSLGWAVALASFRSALAAAPVVFNTTPAVNDLQGSLRARVQFAQSQIIPARPRPGDRQPHLIGGRKTLLLVKPLEADDRTPLTVTVGDARGRTLGTVQLDPPDKLPASAYHVDGIPCAGVDFKPRSDTAATVHDGGDLAKLAAEDAAYLAGLLAGNDLVRIDTADGRWTRDIHLPADGALDGKVVQVQSDAGYNSTIHYSDRQAVSRAARPCGFSMQAASGFARASRKPAP